jgi:hypothetical protein
LIETRRVPGYHLSSMSPWVRLGLTLAARGILHPTTGVALLRVGWRFRARDWYRRFPPLPFPARDYLRWRMYTAFGDEAAVPSADDVVRYARWAVKDP